MSIARLEAPIAFLYVAFWHSHLPAAAITDINTELLQPLPTSNLPFPQKIKVSNEWLLC